MHKLTRRRGTRELGALLNAGARRRDAVSHSPTKGQCSEGHHIFFSTSSPNVSKVWWLLLFSEWWCEVRRDLREWHVGWLFKENTRLLKKICVFLNHIFIQYLRSQKSCAMCKKGGQGEDQQLIVHQVIFPMACAQKSTFFREISNAHRITNQDLLGLEHVGQLLTAYCNLGPSSGGEPSRPGTTMYRS